MQTSASLDRAQGSMLGLLVGDAAGVPLEFLGRVSQKQVEDALLFPGGGVFRVGRYQVKNEAYTHCTASLGSAAQSCSR